ncbi:substrate-binding domain-containing protein [Haloplanus sp. GCM10025708]|uniref:substrate-binding domain-containing protein n=1 Tax=Haloplanus sp. GCM10025708 TaxID=3252679 RepID=UPI003620E3B2
MKEQRKREQYEHWKRVVAGSSRRGFLRNAGALGLAGLAGCSGGSGGSGGTATPTSTPNDSDGGSDTQTATSTPTETPMADSMTIFHAGSLAPPFSAAEPQFEEGYGVDVTREAKGSVASTQKIVQQRRNADVLGVSDFRLIRNRVLPDYGDWYAIFTTNSMSLQYREDSPGADEISADNWWEVLSRDDVTVGHADPAVDPGGYRAVMTQQLGKYEFEGEKLYDDSTFQKIRENSTVPTGTETKLEDNCRRVRWTTPSTTSPSPVRRICRTSTCNPRSTSRRRRASTPNITPRRKSRPTAGRSPAHPSPTVSPSRASPNTPAAGRSGSSTSPPIPAGRSSKNRDSSPSTPSSSPRTDETRCPTG